jgi:hypothetical protein
MRLILILTGVGLVLLSGVASTHAQVPPPSQVHKPAPSIGGPSQDQAVHATGCIQRESDYRLAHLGSGGVTIVGAGDDFVLINASVSLIGSPIAGTKAETPRDLSASSVVAPDAREPRPVALPGTTGVAFDLTGPRESEVAVFVGRWVEIAGTLLEPSPITEAIASPVPARSPQVADVTTRTLNLRQLEVDSARALGGACATP